MLEALLQTGYGLWFVKHHSIGRNRPMFDADVYADNGFAVGRHNLLFQFDGYSNIPSIGNLGYHEAQDISLESQFLRHAHIANVRQMNAFAVVSDSGTLPEESSFFTSVGHPFPAICIRTSTERPEALDKACFFIAGIDEASLLQAVDTAVAMNQQGDYGTPVPDYIEENVSTKVVKIIQSYTGIVNRTVWRKY